VHPEDPFRTDRCYPATVGRSSPGRSPPEVSPLGSRLRASTESPLMGFHTSLTVVPLRSDRSPPTPAGRGRVCSAEYQRTAGPPVSCETDLPPRASPSSSSRSSCRTSWLRRVPFSCSSLPGICISVPNSHH
jgi:hypothetical protein